jgi:hypothetical protein
MKGTMMAQFEPMNNFPIKCTGQSMKSRAQGIQPTGFFTLEYG